MHVAEALEGLLTYGSLGKALWFGFGAKNMVRTLAATEEGSTCLALCAAVSECYNELVAAEVFVEMVKSSQSPEDLRPSILQWKALLQSCAGVFAATPFPEKAERYMQLHPHGRSLGYEPLQSPEMPRRGCSSPKSLAEALLALAKVTRGEFASVMVIGGADAGWLAAVGEWLFDLSVQVVQADGT
ncbi:MAG: hypothetical protein M1813_000623 [Trichoglossum hirsutum]|nr:MAG: hypothetical protein M1813_000623 [Trichoglossum hirsutum]